ncbi:hypothetical protein NDU88_007964 [Pleurodeles waltl]|uniref:Uncharacterized protein n=1 Tax=Pleurodeles waltl TaxID=8319 RepID=A0AAV7RSG0_PLEWA|nr:hypothetical protein NDU88_007964 [Pleurodeles waltl]
MMRRTFLLQTVAEQLATVKLVRPKLLLWLAKMENDNSEPDKPKSRKPHRVFSERTFTRALQKFKALVKEIAAQHIAQREQDAESEVSSQGTEVFILRVAGVVWRTGS